MPKREPLWKKFAEWWPVAAGVAVIVGWITTTAVRGAQDEAKLAEHEKKLEEKDVKDKEQDQQLTSQMVQYQLIQQSLGGIAEQLKDIKAQHR